MYSIRGLSPRMVYKERRHTGHGPENITRLRRFAVGIIQSKGVSNVAQKMRQPQRSTRLVFDYLRCRKTLTRAPVRERRENKFARVGLRFVVVQSSRNGYG